MLKKLVFVLVLAVLLSQFTVSTIQAGSNCPPGFEPEPAMHRDDHHHQHVGTSTDQNEDDTICVKHITSDGSIHVHIDNNLP